MSEDFFEVPMASDVVKLLNMFFGMSMGQHFVLDKEDEVKPWFVAYGEPKSGKGFRYCASKDYSRVFGNHSGFYCFCQAAIFSWGSIDVDVSGA